MRFRRASGFTLIEMMVVVAVISVLGGMSVPSIRGAVQLYSLNSSGQSVTSAIRGARYIAVSRNKTVRVLFNNPTARQISVVDLAGASLASVQMLATSVTFGAFKDVQIDASGRITPLTGCPICVTGTAPASIAVSNGGRTRTITVTGNGQVSLN